MFDVSVIIATYNGAKKISSLLEALLHQTFPNFEVIVVIDGSTDNTEEVIAAYVHKFRSLRVFTQPNSGRSRVRNRGASEGSAEIFVFYDDDMIPASDSVEKHVRAHAQSPGILITGNQVELIDGNKTDVQNYKASRVAKWMGKYDKPVTRLGFDNLFFSAANCSMSRSTFQRLGGFDERLRDAEDYHLAYRALTMGLLVLLHRDNRAVHHDLITARSYVKRQREYAIAHRKLNELFSEGASPESTQRSGLKHKAYQLFARPLWVDWIDTNRFWFLPKNIRYKLYDVILHALSVEYPNVGI